MMIWPQICCTQYKLGKCLHPAAPTNWFGSNFCLEAVPYDTKDDRVGIINKCKVKIPYQKPGTPPRLV